MITATDETHYEPPKPPVLTDAQMEACVRWGIDPERAVWLLTCPRETYRKPNDEPRPGEPRKRLT